MDAIVFDQVTKVYQAGFKKKTAVDSLSLTIPSGVVFGFLGPNGSGKSTTIKILLNILFPTTGQAYLLDCPVTEKSVRTQVGYLPENPYLYDHLTPEELMQFGGRTSGMGTRMIRERSGMLLERVGLTPVKRQPLRTFSKGMVQRAGLALALIHDPQVVILDEPMSGLDPLGHKLMRETIQNLHQSGKTVFLCSHNLHDVEGLCDRIGIIINGHLQVMADLHTLLSDAPTGWRMVVRGGTDLHQALPDCRVTSMPDGGMKEIQSRETDLYKLMDRIRALHCHVISVVPVRKTLEDVFLAELQKSGERSDP